MLMKLLINRKIDIDIKDKNGLTALFYAVEAKNLKTVKLLVEAGAKTNEKDNEGKTIFEIAKKINDKDILMYFDKIN